MIQVFRNNKSASLLFFLACLLIGSGMANAMILCQESRGFSHLEYNPSGDCQDVCLMAQGGSENPGLNLPLLSSWPSADDCLDTPVSLSHIAAPGDTNLLANPISSAGLGFHFTPIIRFATYNLPRLNLVALPPPSQALISLRTIVLLH